MSKILLVDDDAQGLESTRKILEFAGFEVETAMDGQCALEKVRPGPGNLAGDFDVILTDVRMPRMGGLEFLRALNLCGKKVPVILMTAYGRVDDAVWAMKFGAVDFLTKPFKRQVLLASVEAAIKRNRGRNLSQPFSPLSASSPLEELLVGRSEAIRSLKDLVQRVSSTHVTVLLTGESGTGKELVARCLHQKSPRASARFVAVNCAAIPEQLIESELFGFEKGAFTGAHGSKEGLFESAHGGTLLLDEIGDMPLSVQAKLLRVLQEGEVRRIGVTQARKIDVRVIAATHKDLKEEVRKGTFRQDLLYRLEVVGMQVPPLRDRLEDIPELAYHFLGIACKRHGKNVLSFSEETLEILLSHSWPGNVRELSNVVERAVVFATSDSISLAELPPHLIDGANLLDKNRLHRQPSSPIAAISVPLGTPLKDVQELLIRKTLEATSGDKNMTAKLLGINSRTIYRKLDKKIEPEPDSEMNPS